jgi:hypothetical protein
MEILFQNFYFKFAIAAVMALLITFANDIKVLRDRFILIMIFIALMLMTFFSLKQDVGIVLLLVALYVLCYNLVIIHNPR